MAFLNYLTVLISFLIVFLTFKNERTAIKLIILSLSISIPFKTDFIPFGLPGALIISFTIAKALKHSFVSHSHRVLNPAKKSGTMRVLYYLLFIGLFTGLLNTANGVNYEDASGSTNIKQLLIFSSYIIILILFIRILAPFRNDIIFQNELMKTFCVSIFIHATSYFVFSNAAFYSSLFYVSEFDSAVLNTEIVRFCSLIGDYELTIDYVLIVIALSLILFYNEKGYVNLIYILPSLWIGMMTGTRSFVVTIAIFIFLFLLLSRNIKLILASTFLFIVATVFFLSGFIPSIAESDNALIARLNQTFEEVNGHGNVAQITNRDFSKTAEKLLMNTNIFGNGAFYFNSYGGSEMVSHNLILAVYAKYGVPGLLILLFFLCFMLSGLTKVLRRTPKGPRKFEAQILLILLVCLFFQELKISAIRNVSIMLVYSYVFFCINTLKIRAKHLS
jgi:hypothetical protein